MRSFHTIALDLVHGINAAVRPLDARLFAPVARARRGPLFIVGAPRSGTTLLFQALAHRMRVTYLPRLLNYGYGFSHLAFRIFGTRIGRHRPVFVSRFGTTPGLLSPSESFSFWRKWFWKGHDGDHDFSAPLDGVRAADLAAAVHAIEAHLDAPLLVKCPYLVLGIPALAAALPDARFIHIARDPIDVATSILRGRARANTGEWWSVRPRDYAAHLADPETGQVMWQVAETTTAIRSALEALPAERSRFVRYEDFCADPRGTLARLASWLAPLGFETWPDDDVPERFVAPEKMHVDDDRVRSVLAATPDFARAQAAIA